PGLESITFTGKMHSMPRLARPVFPSWDPDWMHLLALLHEHLLYRPGLLHLPPVLPPLEGVKQALWLNKTKLIEGLPEKVSSLTGDPRDHTEDQDEPVVNAISHAHLWHSTENILKRETYCSVIVDSLIRLYKSQMLKHPSLTRQIYAQNSISSGAQVNAKNPLPPIVPREEVEATENHECNVYDVNDDTGFLESYLYPYPHTQYLWAKMILSAFGNVLAQACFLYGNDPKVLEQPVVTQSMGTHGRVFLVLQLNTTDLAFEEDLKNLA
ncbi:hypothetical protein FD755_001152, partial [Muntiacus reevesi]